MPPSTATPPRLRERMVSAVMAAYYCTEVHPDGVERRILRNADRFQMIVLDPVEEARLESLSALAPVGWGRAELEADMAATLEDYRNDRRQAPEGV